MDLKGIFFLAIFFGLMFFGFAVWDRVNRTNRATAFLSEKGMGLDYTYKNFLGLNQEKRKVFLNVGQPVLLDADQVRRVEKNSILQTKSNAWGMQFHKEKNCALTIHTDDIGTPTHSVSFDDPKEMALWYSRLCAFCNLS